MRPGDLWLVTLVMVALGLGACTRADTAQEPGPQASGVSSPEESVSMLVELLDSGDFDAAADLAMPEQAALATLAEGATFGEVAEAIRTGDPEPAVNFWAGFAQRAGNLLRGPIDTSGVETITRDGVEYHIVGVVPASGGERELLTRDEDGFRIDLFASFAPGLAPRMVGPVERLLNAQTEDSRLVLSELAEVVPSLLVAAERPGQPQDVVQAVLRLVELITRVS